MCFSVALWVKGSIVLVLTIRFQWPFRSPFLGGLLSSRARSNSSFLRDLCYSTDSVKIFSTKSCIVLVLTMRYQWALTFTVSWWSSSSRTLSNSSFLRDVYRSCVWDLLLFSRSESTIGSIRIFSTRFLVDYANPRLFLCESSRVYGSSVALSLYRVCVRFFKRSLAALCCCIL